MAFKIVQITDFDSFNAMKKEWNELVVSSSSPSVFFLHEWFYNIWKSYDFKNVVILCLYNNSKLVAIAPFYIVYEDIMCINKKILKSLSNYNTEIFDFIITNDERHDLVVDNIIKYIFYIMNIGKVIMVNISNTSNTLNDLEVLHKNKQVFFQKYESLRSPYLIKNLTWDEYIESIDKHFLKNIQQRETKLRKTKILSFDVYDRKDTFEVFWEKVCQVERKSWKFGNGTSIISKNEEHDFYKNLSESFASCGYLKGFILSVDGIPVGHQLRYVFLNTYYSIKTSYDEDYKQYAIGPIMYKKSIEYFYKDKCMFLKFLGQDDPHKMKWTGVKQYHYNVIVYRRNFPYSVDYFRHCWIRNMARKIIGSFKKYRDTQKGIFIEFL